MWHMMQLRQSIRLLLISQGRNGPACSYTVDVMVLLMVTFIEVGGARNVCWLLVTMWLYFFDPAAAVVFCWSHLFDACDHNFIILCYLMSCCVASVPFLFLNWLFQHQQVNTWYQIERMSSEQRLGALLLFGLISYIYLCWYELCSSYNFIPFVVIVKATNGPRYVVGCRRQLDKAKLKSGTRVALDMTTLTIMRYLPREVDPLVYNMSHEDPGDVSYAAIGGLSEQIRELREVTMQVIL
jgi:hypothetical protein